MVVFISPAIAFLGYVSYFYVALPFGLSPSSYSMSKYFKKRGYEKGIVEYGFIRKITYLLVPVVILLFAISTHIKTPNGIEVILTVAGFDVPVPYLPQVILTGIWGFALMGGLIWIVILSRKEDFEFYFARVFIVIASKEKDETKRAKYFIKGLKFYDRYLRRTINLQINNIKEIYSKVIIDSNIDPKRLIHYL